MQINIVDTAHSSCVRGGLTVQQPVHDVLGLLSLLGCYGSLGLVKPTAQRGERHTRTHAQREVDREAGYAWRAPLTGYLFEHVTATFEYTAENRILREVRNNPQLEGKRDRKRQIKRRHLSNR